MTSINDKPRAGRLAEDDDVLFRYQLANSAISFLKCLAEKGSYPLLLAYLHSLSQRLPDCARHSQLNTYFFLYHIYEGMHILSAKQKIPDKMAALNFRLAPSLKGAEIGPDIERTVNLMIGTRG
jgi:hypothetical protein